MAAGHLVGRGPVPVQGGMLVREAVAKPAVLRHAHQDIARPGRLYNTAVVRLPR